MDARELAWASGLFDGEGCIASHNGGTAVALMLAMTDQDAVRRFHRAVGVGSVHPTFANDADRKPMWRWRVVNREGVQAVIAMLWYGLNGRRKDRYKELHFNYQPKTSN